MIFLKYCKYINSVALWSKLMPLISLPHGNQFIQERNGVKKNYEDGWIGLMT